MKIIIWGTLFQNIAEFSLKSLFIESVIVYFGQQWPKIRIYLKIF
jgi:hypothetical protein